MRVRVSVFTAAHVVAPGADGRKVGARVRVAVAVDVLSRLKAGDSLPGVRRSGSP